MSRVLPRRGRREPNAEAADRRMLDSALRFVLDKHGVAFGDAGKREEKAWRLYRDMLLLAPALVLSSGLPVNVHGVGTYRLTRSAGGRRRLRSRFSQRVDDVANKFERVEDENLLDEFAFALRKLSGGGCKDSSVVEVDYGY